MGYLIRYTSESKNADGQITTDVGEVSVGDPSAETSLALVAGRVMAMMARRSVLITSVEVFEYQLKKIAYREGDDGIVLGNKKFRFDDGAAMPEPVSIAPDADDPVLALQKELAALKGQLATQPARSVQAVGSAVPRGGEKTLRRELFAPTHATQGLLPLATSMAGGKLSFTPNKLYPIHSEEVLGNGMIVYVTRDDTARKVKIPGHLFVPPAQERWDGLVSETAGAVRGDDVQLSMPGEIGGDLPALR